MIKSSEQSVICQTVRSKDILSHNVWGAGALQVTKASQRFIVRASAEQNVDVEAVVKDLQEKVRKSP